MKRRDARRERRGEGWLIAAALGLVLAAALGIWMDRQPRAVLAAPVHSVCEEAVARAARIDVNLASAEELATLPGVGEVLAARIVAWRAENGPFRDVEALTEVPGIGEGKLEAMRDYIRLD